MSRAIFAHRLGRLEQASGTDALSPAFRRWLGQPLTPAEHDLADLEQKRVAAQRVDLSALSPAARSWLADHGDLTGHRTPQLREHR